MSEIIFGTSDGLIIAVNTDNQMLDYFPLETGVGVTGSPMLSDLDNDGDIEVVVGANTTLFAIDIKEPSSINDSWRMHRGNMLRNGSFTPSDYQMGDLNGDMLFNVLDIVLLSNLILSENFNDSDFLLADLNSDSFIDILDIVILINLILL